MLPAAIVAARNNVAKGMLEAQKEAREIEESERVEEESAEEARAVLEREQREREEDAQRAKAKEEIEKEKKELEAKVAQVERVRATPILRRYYTTRMHVPTHTLAACGAAAPAAIATTSTNLIRQPMIPACAAEE